MESYPLTFSSWGNEELEALQRVIRSGQFTMGQEVKRFEEAFAEKFGHRYAVMVNSGSSANLLAVSALKYSKKYFLPEGSEVIVPALAWSTTYAPLFQMGLKIKVVDIDLESLNANIASVESAITPQTKMVVGVSILGNPSPLPELKKICEAHNLILMEDNCESLGAKISGKYSGTFGLLSTCSFFYAHHISTMEGGMVATNEQEIYELLLCLRAHGWTKNLPETSLINPEKQDSFNEAYRFLLPGYNFRPLEFSGAAGFEQLKKFDHMAQVRRKNWLHFREIIGSDTRFIFQKENGEASPYCFTFIVKEESGMKREKVLERLRENNIEFRMITGGNVMQHEYAKKLGIQVAGKLKNVEMVHNQGFFIGNGAVDLRKKIDHLAKVIKNL